MTNENNTLTLRPAIAADETAIRAIIHQARLNPMSLDWPRFMVVEIAGRVAGVGQVKPHRDGSRELASIAVRPEFQGKGIASRIIEALLAQEKGPVYLFCADDLERFYDRFGFQKIQRNDLPPTLSRIHRLGNFMAKFASRVSGKKFSIISMLRS